MTRITSIAALLQLLIFWIVPSVPRPAVAAEEQPGSPNAVLWDTRTSSIRPWDAASIKLKATWEAVPEDDLSHRVQGDLVASNDRLVLVLRGKGIGAEVYAQTASGPKLRVVLSPIGASENEPGRLASVRILENNPGAVVLSATFAATGGSTGSRSLTYRVTAGQAFVELRPGEGTGRVRVQQEARYVVVPDFFGDDMVFPAATLSRPRLRLPVETFFLNLSNQGNSLVMCVWQSRKQGAVAVRSAAVGPPAIAACEVEAAKDKSLWIALLEGAKVWHAQSISAGDAKAETALQWAPPFPAKWRADLLGANGSARSWYFHSPGESGDASPRVTDRPSPCCLEGDRALLRLAQEATACPPAWPYPSSLVVYGMDRSRTTPLTTFCPIDILRNTLGVGPCQYILQTEGLASETNPTPDNVMTAVEKQFKRKKQKSAANEIREMLDQMVRHVGHAQARIQQYGRLARDIGGLPRAGEPDKNAAAGVEAIERLAARLGQAVAQRPARRSGGPRGQAGCRGHGADRPTRRVCPVHENWGRNS